MRRTTSESAATSPTFNSIPAGRRFTLDRFNDLPRNEVTSLLPYAQEGETLRGGHRCLSFGWKFAAKMPNQVCHDKLISRKIKLAASVVDAIWEVPYVQDLPSKTTQKEATVCQKAKNRGPVIGSFIRRP
ncbi:hypothetical protein AVEN_145666-1 [Araneus ventricosus]|uniref:Uncharacterized protein n=1 Tax=Araneus ventricosus TaxID=182803 RepID=A0A4Y2KYJ0_ARAVE|nr:hypothetical protein AVEN_145666-1 [Araneus ventricosus]